MGGWRKMAVLALVAKEITCGRTRREPQLLVNNHEWNELLFYAAVWRGEIIKIQILF